LFIFFDFRNELYGSAKRRRKVQVEIHQLMRRLKKIVMFMLLNLWILLL
jgi:hypothetical protein